MKSILEAFQQRCLMRLHMLAALLALQERLTLMHPSRARLHAQLTLFCPVQEFDRGFAPGGLRPVRAGFAVDQPERPAAFRVSGALSCGVFGQAPVEIRGDAGIQAPVRAGQHIDHPGHRARVFTHTAP